MVSTARGRVAQAVAGGALIVLCLIVHLMRPVIRDWIGDSAWQGLGWIVLVIAWGCLVGGATLIARSRMGRTDDK
ncbi:hypothetical protein [Devriesea agamarum]|uniref:hypothetical protein n=1 Tax=Devriesea agamarum TaxID=472569 RepID=UPI00071C4EE4|nr:hypothetical protein [Devriesea agamarum]